MDKQPEITNLEVALAAAEIGIVPIPCHPLTKVPCVKWKEWQAAMPPIDLIEKWFADSARNIGILTTSMVLFDCDDPAKASLVVEECGETPHRLRTPRGGIHLGFRRRKGAQIGNQVKIRGQPIDIRTTGGIEMIPPSRTPDGRYEWIGEGLLPLSDLPFGNIGWTRERTRKRTAQVVAPPGSADFMEYRASRWLEVIARESPAVSGQGGHRATFRVACKLVHSFGLGRDAAIRLMLAIYNPHCKPPWSEGEIEHKVESAIERGKAPS